MPILARQQNTQGESPLTRLKLEYGDPAAYYAILDIIWNVRGNDGRAGINYYEPAGYLLPWEEDLL